MPHFQHVLSAVVGLAALLSTVPASAVPVVAGSPAVFNFRTVSPGTFTSFQLVYEIDTCSVFEDARLPGCTGQVQPDAGLITLFDGLNGTGTSSVVGFWSDSAFSGGDGGRVSGSYTAVADGIFSLVYAASIGAIDVGVPYAVLTNAQGSVRVDGVSDAVVPEPASIALLGIGSLAAVGAARGRRAARPRSMRT